MTQVTGQLGRNRHNGVEHPQVNKLLSVTSQYALRALAELATKRGGDSMLGKDLAEKAEIPHNYLAKILLTLKNAGLLGTARGSRGGYWLVRPPESIRLIEIVQLFDQTATPQPCVLGYAEPCATDELCCAHKRWNAIRTTYLEFLDATTIADLARGNPSVKEQEPEPATAEA